MLAVYLLWVPWVHEYLRDEAALLPETAGLVVPALVGEVEQLVGPVQPRVVVVHQGLLLLLE